MSSASSVVGTPLSGESVELWLPPELAGLEIEWRSIDQMRTPPTVIADYEITIPTLLTGTARLRVRGETHTFTTFDFTKRGGLVLLSNPGDVGSSESVPDIGARALTLRLPEHLLNQYMSKLAEAETLPHFPAYEVAGETRTPLANLARDVALSFQHEGSLLERESKLLALVHALVMYCADDPPKLSEVGKEHRAVALIKEAIHADVAGDFSLDQLAVLTGLNPRYFLSVFKREVGVSPHEYQTNLRVLRAKQLLSRGLPIAAVAIDTGFNDQSHLTRVFKMYTFTTPGRFRRAGYRNA